MTCDDIGQRYGAHDDVVITSAKHAFYVVFFTNDDIGHMYTVPLTYVIMSWPDPRSGGARLEGAALGDAGVRRATRATANERRLLSKTFFSFLVSRGTPKI